MGVEIERKFLVISEEWRENAKAVTYKQGYLCDEKDRTARVRIAGDKGFITVKGASVGASCPEYEYEIPKKDAAEMLDKLCLPGKIEKIRHKLPFAGLTWEVDEFQGENAGLIVAEVEIPSEDHPVTLPPWVGEEVTNDPRYKNAALAKNPYSQWKDAKKCQTPKH